jgi:hypothetical protein
MLQRDNGACCRHPRRSSLIRGEMEFLILDLSGVDEQGEL